MAIEKKTHIPLCLKTYEQLFKMIKNNELHDKMPSETALAKQLKVSRTTLRQALAFLQDDGLVRIVRGVGNFVVNNTDVPPEKDKSTALEKLQNPLYQIHDGAFDSHKFDFLLELDSDYTQEIFQKKSPAVISCDRCFYKSNKMTAFVFSFLPIDTVTELNINLQDSEEFFDILQDKIYQYCTKSDLEIKLSNSANIKYKMVGNDTCFLFIETLYKDDRVICHNKFYIPKQFAKINLTRNNDIQ